MARKLESELVIEDCEDELRSSSPRRRLSSAGRKAPFKGEPLNYETALVSCNMPTSTPRSQVLLLVTLQKLKIVVLGSGTKTYAPEWLEQDFDTFHAVVPYGIVQRKASDAIVLLRGV